MGIDIADAETTNAVECIYVGGWKMFVCWTPWEDEDDD